MPRLPESVDAADLLQDVLSVALTPLMLLRPVPGGAGAPPDFVAEYLNPAAQRAMGLPERPEQPFSVYFPDLAEVGLLAFYQRVFDTGAAEEFEVKHPHGELTIRYRVAARRHAAWLLVSFSDETGPDRRGVEELLRESRARERAARAEAEAQRQQLYALVMQAPACIARLEGPELVFTLVNPCYQQLVGARPLLGQPLRQAWPDLEGQPFFSLLEGVYQTGETYYGHEQLAFLDRSNAGRLEPVYFDFIYQAVRDAAGAISGVHIFAYDVTGTVRARQQLQYLNQELEAANQALGTANVELHAGNEEFLRSNAALEQARQQLAQLNEELEARVQERTAEAQAARAEAEHQRARLEDLFMRAPAAIAICLGPELIFELANPACRQLFPGRELLGRPLLAALPEVANEPIYRLARQVQATGMPQQELGLLLPLARPADGLVEERYFDLVLQPHRDAAGRINGLVCFAFEVTVQVQARRVLEQNAEYLRQMADNVPAMIWITNAAGACVYLNQQWYTFTGQTEAEALGHGWFEMMHPDDQPAARTLFANANAGQSAFTMAYRQHRHDGRYRWVLDSGLPRYENDGRFAGFVGTVFDVHEQKQAEQALQRLTQKLRAARDQAQALNADLHGANEQLRRTNVDLDNFIYTASHDLKSPIVNIEGLLHYLQALLQPATLPADVQPVLDMMQDAVGRFHRTIDHLSDVIKLQKEHDQPLTDVPLQPVVDDVLLDLQPLIREAAARIEVEFSACPSVSFAAKNLRSVIYNLVSNALKYRHPERPAQVRISCRPAGDYLELTVADNGLGLEPAQQAGLFTMFRRFHGHVEGSGIGLYMVKRSVENAGGRVEVRSEPGVGSAFMVYLRR